MRRIEWSGEEAASEWSVDEEAASEWSVEEEYWTW